MNGIKSERGQALILIAFGIVALVGFTALAVDGGRVLSDRRHAQNAADTAAFAAALAKINGEDYQSAGQNRAQSNGYNNDADSTVEVILCSNAPASDPCTGLPPAANPAEYIRVRITSDVPMTFARVLGRNEVTNIVEAIAKAQGTTSSTLFGGAALVSLKQSGTAFSGNGNFSLDVNGSGIFSNSNSNCSTQFTGNGTIQVDTAITIASGGTQCRNGNLVVPNPVAGAQVPYPPNISVPEPSFTCPVGENRSGNTFNPGTYNATTINTNGIVTFTPGNYCFNGSISINGNVNVIANNVNFRINSGQFSINGNSTFTCNNMLVYGAGGSGMHFNGNGSNSCTNVTFYMASGDVYWNGNVANTFTAPTSGDYKGLLIYMPYGNNSNLIINGNSGNQLTGSIIAISSPITINGNSGTNGLHTQIIGYEISLAGNSNTIINFDASEQYNPPSSPTIELTK
ncbi:MAG TPA: pilus assembly protein TadG-related protein [Anaerolineales bacterium]|nr:pilus assembly protein TadG-related protein [Anaerolineales bacterium]